jgi:hypothetical protein
MELGVPRRKRKPEPGDDSGDNPDDDSFGVFGELDVDPGSELPVHEKFVSNKNLRKAKK